MPAVKALFQSGTVFSLLHRFKVFNLGYLFNQNN